MSFFDLKDFPSKHLFPGFEGKIFHTDQITLSYWEIKAGSILPEHSHFHEQTTHVLSGELELIIENESKILSPGQFAIIPSNAKHSGIAHTDCVVLDTFTPVREDYKQL
ncbi:MAG: cupin domain-containing protein [Bacteroidota bacterium]